MFISSKISCDSAVQNAPRDGDDATMDKPKIIRRPDVLRKINAENILAIERGLLGGLPEKLKPKPPEPVRGRPNELALVPKPSGLLSSCLPVVIESPVSAPLTPTPMDDEVSPLKKSFSFRDKFSRISLFGNKEKPKWKTIEEVEKKTGEFKEPDNPKMEKLKSEKTKTEHESKSSKRFWLFRNKELVESRKHTPIYKRSKSFEFLPRAMEEGDEDLCFTKRDLTKNQSYVFGSTDTMGDAWTSNESLEYISNVYYDNEDTVFLKSIKEFPSELSSANNSSISTATSESSGLVVNIFKRESVQDLLEEFDKAVDMFSENYLSDCEPYTKPKKELSVQEKRRSSSFDTFHINSPKIVPVSKVSELSDDFKKELSKALKVKRVSAGRSPTARRGSVTDWFVLEDQHAKQQAETNKYRRAQKKPINRCGGGGTA
ncbi:hypothetical protein MSG28_005575 [Choristoneura fumiferana]|uniref:Uncharacterized protein n=1 Tax=Choristoneura fumiferana TaxID=7141 RepID=A0ACC0KZW1_CHOFU|nr:hypothetical protein MSG28_005575 [Choristoneura fumiferana]